MNGKDPNCAGPRSEAHRFKQWGGVRGAQVSLKEKARAMAGLIVVPVVLGVTCRAPFVRNIRHWHRPER